MNHHRCTDHERYEALIASWFDADALSADERAALTSHVATCPGCRESFELAKRLETALVSRSSEVPALDGLLPELAPAAPRVANPRLVGVLRAVLSPAGISIVMLMWGTMLLFRFRDTIARALESSEKFTILSSNLTGLLLSISRGDEYTLIAIYVALAALLIGSTGAITMRYIRHS